ncbi:MAG TPA: sialidase family protein [Aridibacter sp.]|nr:sialidase family protein [Aridibacter sp.]
MSPAIVLNRIAVATLLVALPLVYSASKVSGGAGDPPEPPSRSLTIVGEFLLPEFPEKTEFRSLTLNSFSDRLLASYFKAVNGRTVGQFFRLSRDGGKTFRPEIDLSNPAGTHQTFPIVEPYLFRDGVAAIGFRSGELFFFRKADGSAAWTKPVRINDEISSVGTQASLLEGPGNTLYCAWLDLRRGFPLIYFSSSNDGGETWGPNRPIEFDFREGDQIRPKLVRGADGRILAFWEDHRDRRTLVDIRYSYSDDGGRHWSPSARVNDDGLHVWQINYDAVSRGSLIYVVFSDFRDPGEGGDNDWNIYFAASPDNGSTFRKNRRVNDVVSGKDDEPRLAVNDGGELFCAWRTERDSIFGDVAVTFSEDGGANWAPSRVVSLRETEGEIRSIGVVPLERRTIAAVWDRESYGSVVSGNAAIELSDRATGPAESVPPPESREPLKLKIGEKLFEDDFSGSDSGKWDEFEGVWMRVRGSYMGLAPVGRRPFSTFLTIPEPENYVLEGKFRLGEISHFVANIFLRTNADRRRYLMIGNRFRKGTWLSVKDDDLPTGLHHIGGRVILQRSYLFQSDRWYRFKVVVTTDRIDYFIDDSLIWSADAKAFAVPGNIGLGGYENAPTYFDDITMHSMDP